MKIICLVQHFRQGWGGAPESIRLLAQVLADEGISVDVYDRGRFHPAVEQLALLPQIGFEAPPFDLRTLESYGAVLIVGPWQSQRALRPVLRARRASQPLLYLPRGGLGRIEFSRLRDSKKWPYFYLVEHSLLDASTAIVFSSNCEQSHTIAAARYRTREVIIPDFFTAPAPLAEAAVPASDPVGKREIRFGFMAEVSPRKGLLPLVEAFLRLARRPGFDHPVRLSIGGAPRRGSEAYYEHAQELARSAPLHATIEFVGPISHDFRLQFYHDTDVFVVPSLFESFGLTVLEALAAGCAEVVGSEIGVLQFLSAHPRLSIVREVGLDALADALARQFELALAEGRSTRVATTAFADQSISALNRLAVERWRELLRS
jgi:glycosyltransferase involved in cell wall biosynthesis